MGFSIGTSIMMSKQKKLEELINFTNQLEVMVLSGLSFSESMEILEKTITCSAYHNKLKDMNVSLKEGASIKNCLHPQLFPSFYVHTIGIGEASGNLDHSLSTLREFYEKELNWVKQRNAIMVYPKILLVCSLFLLILTSKWIIPSFENQQGTQTGPDPWYFKIPMFINDHLLWFFILSLTLGCISKILMRNNEVHNLIRRVLCKLSMIVPVINSLSIAKMQLTFSENLKTLIQCGATIPEAIAYIGDDSDQIFFAKSLQGVEDSLHLGDSLHLAMEKNKKLFSPFMIHLIRAGEESGDLVKVLDRMIYYLEGKHIQSMTKFYKILEPVIIIIMASYIGLIMLSILLPMLDTFDAILP